MTARAIYVHTARTYWRRAGYLLVLGIAVFVPLGLIDALANLLWELDWSNLGELGTIALGGGFVVQVFTSLLGEVFYAGAVALALAKGEDSEPPSFRSVARRLAYWRLIAVDIIFGIGSVLGLLLLVVPGIVFFAWFALAGPVVELEGAGVRAAFARSRNLVRGRFWTVLLVLLPIAVVSEVLSESAVEAAHLLVHASFLSDWAGESVSNVVLSPFYAVAAVLMTINFSGRGR